MPQSSFMAAVALVMVAFVGPSALGQWTRSLDNSQAGVGYGLTVVEDGVLAGVNNGVFFTANGTIWEPRGQPATNIRATNRLGATLYAGRPSGGNTCVYESTDNGLSWANISVNPPTNTWIYTLAVKDGDLFAGGSNRVHRRTSPTWTEAHFGLPSSGRHYILTIVPVGDTLFAGGHPGLYFSTNHGTTWNSISHFAGDTVNVVVRVGGESSAIVVGSNRGLHRTTNGGATWTAPIGIVPGSRILSAAAINSGGAIFAGTNGFGVHLTTNNGANWVPANTGLTAAFVNAVAVIDTFLLAAVNHNTANMRGIWRRPLGQMVRPSDVDLLTPLHGEEMGGDSIAFGWSKAFPPPTHYWLEIATDSSFVNSTVDSSITDTNRVVQGLLPNIYWWRVRARNTLGWGPFSTPRKFVAIFSVNLNVTEGWNVVSNPNITSRDSVHQLFTTATYPYGFRFVPGAGYSTEYRMSNRRGYWVKFPSASGEWLSGAPVYQDSISVAPGWNLIGSISVSVDTAFIRANSDPPNIITSNFFGYPYGMGDPSVEPGRGYWVKTNAAGKLYMAQSPAPPRPATSSQHSPLAGLNELTITDASGKTQTLYFGADRGDGLNLAAFELPPLPPAGAFDARFETAHGGYAVQVHQPEGGALPIAVQSDAYPLEVAWNIASGAYVLADGAVNGASFSRSIGGKGSVTITNAAVNTLMLSLDTNREIPTEFMLAQNYPNPFNPSTTIRVGLPLDAMVTLRIYNVLGQQVTEIVGEEMSAGFHEFRWQGRSASDTQVGSGVYFYRLEARPLDGSSAYVDIRKMLLLK